MPREGHDQELVQQPDFMPLFQSTCPARGTTQRRTWLDLCSYNFNPRAPRGARPPLCAHYKPYKRFQSTCPARGTTTVRRSSAPRCTHFNPRAPRGARRINIHSSSTPLTISIHVPREGHDKMLHYQRQNQHQFQSTCPARGTTRRSNPAATLSTFQSTCPARGTTHLVKFKQEPN